MLQMKKSISFITLASMLFAFVNPFVGIANAETTSKKVRVIVTYPQSDSWLGVDGGELVHEPTSGINFRFSLKSADDTVLCIEEKSVPVVNGIMTYDIGSQYSINSNGVSTWCNMDSLINNSTYKVSVQGDLNKNNSFTDGIDYNSEDAVWVQSSSQQFEDSFLDSKALDIQSNIWTGNWSETNVNYNVSAGLLNTELIANGSKTRSFDLDDDGATEVFSRGSEATWVIYTVNKVTWTYENISSSSNITVDDSSNLFVDWKNDNFVLYGSFASSSVRTNVPATLIAMKSWSVTYTSFTLKEILHFDYFILTISWQDVTFKFNPITRLYEEQLNIEYSPVSWLYNSTTDPSWSWTPFAWDNADYYGWDLREVEVNGTTVTDSDGVIYGDFNNDNRLDFISYKNHTWGQAYFTIYLQNPDGSYKIILDSVLWDGITAWTSIVDNWLKPRYIRDHLNWSNRNWNNHWIELQANEVWSLNNLAQWIIPTSNRNLVNPERVTDGVISSSYADWNQWWQQYITVDLWSQYDLDNVAVWHYYPDGGWWRIYNWTKTEISEDGTNWYSLFDSADSWTYIEPTDGSWVVRNNIFRDTNEFIITEGNTKHIYKINWDWPTNPTWVGESNTVTRVASFDSSFYSILSLDGGTENIDQPFFSIWDGFRDMDPSKIDDKMLLVGNYKVDKDGYDYYDYSIKKYNGTSFVDLNLASTGLPFTSRWNKIWFTKIWTSDFYAFYVDASTEYSRWKQDKTTLYYVYNDEVVEIWNFVVNPNNSTSSQDGTLNEWWSKVLNWATFGINWENVSNVHSWYFGIPKSNYVSSNFSFNTEDGIFDMNEVTTSPVQQSWTLNLQDKYIKSINVTKATYTSNSRWRCGWADSLDIYFDWNLSYQRSVSENRMNGYNRSLCWNWNYTVNQFIEDFRIDYILTSTQQASHIPRIYNTLTVTYLDPARTTEYIQVNDGQVVNYNTNTLNLSNILDTSSTKWRAQSLSSLWMSDEWLTSLIDVVSNTRNSYSYFGVDKNAANEWARSYMETQAVINNRNIAGYSTWVLNTSNIINNKDNIFLVHADNEVFFVSNNLTKIADWIYLDNIIWTYLTYLRNENVASWFRISSSVPSQDVNWNIIFTESWSKDWHHGTWTSWDTTWVVALFNNSWGSVAGTTSSDNYVPPAPHNFRLHANTLAGESVVWWTMNISLDY